MSFWKKVRGVVRAVATLAPILKVLGVKPKTVVGKVGEVAEKVDQIVPPEN